ncbi:MAG TPA: nucleotidyl transferase AbiEii/AbiGii toxin family protein [Solirubrobacteraceae bacterium]|nr:nucleotidyl transferase AbiEii/AbiGii toxin family protein [Solirubrobacteraceae bacterium]
MSDDTVERTQSATRIFRQIQALARSDYGGNTNALLVVYAVEGFLRRLATSQYADKMTLKGGMLMAAMSARRITKDADLSTVGVGNSEAVVAAAVAEIVANKLDVEDGLAFNADSIRTEVMREDAEYHGVRVKLIAHLVTARITTTLDFSFGDPHRSTVIELPELLGTGTIRLASYPPEMSLAEKVATMMSRRELNTRDRDFADTWILSRVHSFRASELRSAIVDVAARRNHEVVTLAAALADMPDRQQTYTAMLGRMAYQRTPPASWRELLNEIRAFIDPLIEDATRQLSKWDPATQTWTRADN